MPEGASARWRRRARAARRCRASARLAARHHAL